MSEHIESNRIETDLHYRFEYLSKFLNFTSHDILLLNQLAPIISPRLPVIADTVYRKLFSFDITKQYFIPSHGFEGSRSNIQFDSTQIQFRKDMLSMYLKRVLTQREWNDTFLQYLSQVGKIHTNQAGLSSINVDYMHINALLGYLQHLLIDILWKSDIINDQIKLEFILAVNKLFWIQNDFFTMHYQRSIKFDDEKSSTQCSMKKSNDSCCRVN